MIPVFYCNAMTVTEGVPATASPSASKPGLVANQWMDLPHIAEHIELFMPHRLSPVRIGSVHDMDYVRGVFGLTRNNGFNNNSEAIANSLPWTTGSMVSAAEHVLRRGGVAASPTSGFHHAGWSGGHGYCTFNGLMLAAMACFSGGGDRVVILDGDRHFGDGTTDIIKRMQWSNRVEHFSFADLVPGRALARSLRYVKGASLVLYQAGADAHVDDPMCPNHGLTSNELAARDRSVFSACLFASVPLVWNLAGGYQRDAAGGIPAVLALHRQTMEICIDVYD